ncbi:MAG TPA: polyamine ABC transporter substrate-binding protein [Verrucomicrobiales bacterium]|nr:polyamine ABC transporter substrate-binding protein [Verrucomicrobiales bacterium]
MHPTLRLLPALLLILSLLPGCGKPRAQLNLFVWSEYIDPKLIAEFEKLNDCRVNVDYYEDLEGMVAKLASGGSSIYDIVVPDDTHMPALIKRGLLAPLRHENVPNLRHILPSFTTASFDPGNGYGAPSDWGTTGLFLRRTEGKPSPRGWGAVFNPAEQPGPFLLLEDPRATIGAALRYDGHSLNSTNMAELTQARDRLIEAKKRSLGFEGATGCKNRVLSKGARVAMAYTGDAVRGMAEDSETLYVTPIEGSQIWVDLLCIPAQAPHRDLAERFINFLLDPPVAARFVAFYRDATCNKSALELVPPADRNNPAIYPPPEVLTRLEYARDLGEMNKLYDEIWLQIKSR